jgi:hypothetical protein
LLATLLLIYKFVINTGVDIAVDIDAVVDLGTLSSTLLLFFYFWNKRRCWCLHILINVVVDLGIFVIEAVFNIGVVIKAVVDVRIS